MQVDSFLAFFAASNGGDLLVVGEDLVPLSIPFFMPPGVQHALSMVRVVDFSEEFRRLAESGNDLSDPCGWAAVIAHRLAGECGIERGSAVVDYRQRYGERSYSRIGMADCWRVCRSRRAVSEVPDIGGDAADRGSRGRSIEEEFIALARIGKLS